MKKLKPHTIDWAQIDRFLAGADKKLASARKILAFDEEACLQQAYEARSSWPECRTRASRRSCSACACGTPRSAPEPPPPARPARSPALRARAADPAIPPRQAGGTPRRPC